MTSVTLSHFLNILIHFNFNYLSTTEATLSDGFNIYEMKCKDNKTCSSRK